MNKIFIFIFNYKYELSFRRESFHKKIQFYTVLESLEN